MIETPDATLAIREWGDPAARPLLFLHGLGPTQSSALFSLAVAPLVRAGFHVVGVDQPGFGGSPAFAPPIAEDAYAVARLADLVWAVADAARLQRPVVVGHSWGGTIATFTAAARPDEVAALVLADSGHLDWGDSAPDLVATRLEDIVRGGESIRMRVPGRVGVAAAYGVPADDLLVDAVLAALVDDGSGGLVSAATGIELGNGQYHAVRARPSETWPAIAAAGIPTLLLLATLPPEGRAANEALGEQFAAAVPQAEVLPVEDSSHQMIIDLRERFGTLAADWLGRVLA